GQGVRAGSGALPGGVALGDVEEGGRKAPVRHDNLAEAEEDKKEVKEEEEEEDDDDDDNDDTLPEHYDPAMFFVESLLSLAEELGTVPPKARTDRLIEGLNRLNEFFLSRRAEGSHLLYVPLRPGFHKIRAIHPRESMHFSTKSRVPLLVCLEVQELSLPDGCGAGVWTGAGSSTEASQAAKEQTEPGSGVGVLSLLRGKIPSFVKLPGLDLHSVVAECNAQGSEKADVKDVGVSNSTTEAFNPLTSGTQAGEAALADTIVNLPLDTPSATGEEKKEKTAWGGRGDSGSFLKLEMGQWGSDI
ncbi:unnamed protein product, partial [Choristocarpus tenellus]